MNKSILTNKKPILLTLIYLIVFTLANLSHANSLPDFTELVEKTTPSVVNISAIYNKNSNNPYNPQGISYGSGFIIELDNKKYVITNNHVTDGANKVLVRFRDKVELPTNIIGSDKLTDIALLELKDDEGRKLPEVKIGDSENLKVGQWVAAIGSPFSFDYSVTAGIISALGRSLPDETYVPFIQSDVAVNQGNSGGPLFNLDAEVIGINSRIFSKTGTYAGLSFSIPIHIAIDVATQLKNTGKVNRGFLGVSISDVSRELVKPFGLKKAHGALVVEVFKDSAAEKGGIINGDIIIKYQNKEIINSGDLPVLVGRTKPGTKANFVILRNGKKESLELDIGSRDNSDSLAANLGGSLGMKFTNLSKSELNKLGIDGGIRVRNLDPNSQEARSGFQNGDIITHFYQSPVANIQQFYEYVSKTKAGTAVPLRVLRNMRQPIYIALIIP